MNLSTTLSPHLQPDPGRRRTISRLKRANGQLTALIAAVESGAGCRNVVTQLSAVRGALDKARFELISTAMRDCLTVPADPATARGTAHERPRCPDCGCPEPAEVAEGVIPGATHIALGELAGRLNELDKSRTVIAVCRNGRRSAAAADQLAAAGYTAYTVPGGMLDRTAAGFPVS